MQPAAIVGQLLLRAHRVYLHRPVVQVPDPPGHGQLRRPALREIAVPHPLHPSPHHVVPRHPLLLFCHTDYIIQGFFHPWQFVPPAWRTRLLWLTWAAAVALAAFLTLADYRLHTNHAPWGMLSLQLPHDQGHAAAIVKSWQDKHPPAPRIDSIEGIVQPVPEGVDKLAADMLVVDFVFILFYALALSMTNVWLPLDSRSAAIGSLLGYLIWFGALCDALENTFLLRMLNGGAEADLVSATRWASGAKFALFLAALGFSAWLLWRRGRRLASLSLASVWTAVAFTVLAALLG